MTAINGNTISQAFKLVANVGKEIDALSDLLKHLFQFKYQTGNSSGIEVDGVATEDSRMDKWEWVYTDYAWSLPVAIGEQGKSRRYIGFQISMNCTDASLSDDIEPMLHVVSWESAISFKDDCFVNFPLSIEDDPYCQVTARRLITWNGENWPQKQWTYSLRLTALNSAADLEKYIVEPVHALLKGASAEDAIADAWFENVLIAHDS